MAKTLLSIIRPRTTTLVGHPKPHVPHITNQLVIQIKVPSEIGLKSDTNDHPRRSHVVYQHEEREGPEQNENHIPATSTNVRSQVSCRQQRVLSTSCHRVQELQRSCCGDAASASPHSDEAEATPLTLYLSADSSVGISSYFVCASEGRQKVFLA